MKALKIQAYLSFKVNGMKAKVLEDINEDQPKTRNLANES
jgi:hypothetical protein